MLPRPTLTLTIPSIHDNTVLDCRIYHPPNFLAGLIPVATRWRKTAAIVAHPYAPLGGCYDDPIVDIVAANLLSYGFFVGTFNFRGAGSSKGRTSWTAKAETDDYASFIGLIVYYMHHLSLPQAFLSDPVTSWNNGELYDLSPIPSHTLPPQQSPRSPRSKRKSMLKYSPVSPINLSKRLDQETKKEEDSRPLLLLGGYSYGALITAQLPPLSSILSLFISPELGTAASEIRLRAEQLAKQQNDLFTLEATSLEAQSSSASNIPVSKHSRGRSLQPDDVGNAARKLSARSSIRLGGEETDPNIRRSSHDSHGRRSFSIEPERLRRSVDRVRSLGRAPLDRSPVKLLRRQNSSPRKQHSSGSGSSSSADVTSSTDPGLINGQTDTGKINAVSLDGMKVSYLLISPLQGIVTKLATMWTVRSKPKGKDSSLNKQGVTDTEMEDKLVVNDTLAIFGDEDVFSSHKNLRSWACRLTSKDTSHFSYAEVVGAGHFWHEDGVVEEMRRHIEIFVSRL